MKLNREKNEGRYPTDATEDRRAAPWWKLELRDKNGRFFFFFSPWEAKTQVGIEWLERRVAEVAGGALKTNFASILDENTIGKGNQQREKQEPRWNWKRNGKWEEGKFNLRWVGKKESRGKWVVRVAIATPATVVGGLIRPQFYIHFSSPNSLMHTYHYHEHQNKRKVKVCCSDEQISKVWIVGLDPKVFNFPINYLLNWCLLCIFIYFQFGLSTFKVCSFFFSQLRLVHFNTRADLNPQSCITIMDINFNVFF